MTPRSRPGPGRAEPLAPTPRPARHPPPFSPARRAALATLTALALLTPLGCQRRDEPGVTRLELWTLALRPWFDDYMAQRIAAFEAQHPGVRVVWVDVPFDAMDRKLIAAAVAGRAPDVVNFSDKNYARFVALDACAPLDGLLPGVPEDRYIPSALRLGRLNGRLLALPWYLTTQTVLANERLLARGGLTPATLGRTWREVLPQAREFKRATGVSLVSVPLGTESDLLMMLLAEGLSPLRAGPDGRLLADLTSPDIAGLIGLWVQAYRDGTLPRESATAGSAHLTELYQNERLAVINSGPNFLKRVREVAPAVFEATRVGPPITGALRRAHIAVMPLAVTRSSRHPRLAAALAWHLTSPQSQELLAERAMIIPSTSSSLGGPIFARPQLPPGAEPTGEQKLALARAITAEAMTGAVAWTPALAAWPDMRRAFEDRIKRVLFSREPAEPALAEVERAWQRLLDTTPGTAADAVPSADPLAHRAAPLRADRPPDKTR